MEIIVLKKKISTFRSKKGSLTRISDEVLFEVLCAWEQWTGPTKDFYRAIGVNQKQIARIIGKAKKLKREGYFPEELFTEIKIDADDSTGPLAKTNGHPPIEIHWEKGKVISFYQVDHLVDFLKKVA